MIASEKVPQLLQLVASISVILGPSWLFWVDEKEWEYARHVSWHPDSSPHQFPVAVDFYSEMGGEGPCKVQVFDLSEPDDDVSDEIREKVNTVIEWCRANNVLHGFEQA